MGLQVGEFWIGTHSAEIIFGERHLDHLVRDFGGFNNSHRPLKTGPSVMNALHGASHGPIKPENKRGLVSDKIRLGDITYLNILDITANKHVKKR